MLCRGTSRGRHSRRLACLLVCLRSHVLRACCNFKLKQEISITLCGRRPNNKISCQAFENTFFACYVMHIELASMAHWLYFFSITIFLQASSPITNVFAPRTKMLNITVSTYDSTATVRFNSLREFY